MRCFILLVFIFYSSLVSAQRAETIINQLTVINNTITSRPYSDTSPIVSNRAMNVFLAYKTGYVGERTDLSFYTNYISLNTADGKFSMSHNFQKPTDIDEPLKRLFNVGISANILKGFVPEFLDKMLENEVAFTISYKWLGKVKTRIASRLQAKDGIRKKLAMDALRASLLHSLIDEIKQESRAFEATIAAIDSVELPGQDIVSAREGMRSYFYEKLQETYALKFATLQATLLLDKQYFKVISTHFTSVAVNTPIIYPAYYVASSLTTKFQQQHSYPFEIGLSHTRFWESTRMGRLFLTIGGKVLNNNSVLCYTLQKTNLSDYKNRGGSDSNQLASIQNNKAYIGLFKTFITPSINLRLNYFPPGSHIGLSILLDQSMGDYPILNARVGMPVVLINSKKLPAVNCEIYVLFYDVNNKLHWRNSTSIGIGIGIPFSRLMY